MNMDPTTVLNNLHAHSRSSSAICLHILRNVPTVSDAGAVLEFDVILSRYPDTDFGFSTGRKGTGEERGFILRESFPNTCFFRGMRELMPRACLCLCVRERKTERQRGR
jgi:hypothetical protein